MSTETMPHAGTQAAPCRADLLLFEPPPVHRTPAEKARILARLTLQLAALDYERRAHGND